MEHSGGGRRQGHYVAFVKTSMGKWCLADDSHVMEVGSDEIELFGWDFDKRRGVIPDVVRFVETIHLFYRWSC